MNPMHEEILMMLKEIDAICRKYDITYYAAGGTTIGAIRHRGFIPWDDDADIYMTRQEFLRFREAFKQERPKDRVLESTMDNDYYPATIPRYIDDTTTMVGKFHVLNTCSAGMVIDVFILDPVPDDEEAQREYIAKLFVYSDFVMPYYMYSLRTDDKYLELYDHYKQIEKEEGRIKVLRLLEKELFCHREEDCNHYVLRWGTLPHVFKKEMFGEPIYFDYEDMQIPLPNMWYEYLVQLYGPKWMYIPYHDDQAAHSHIIDIEHKYTNYLIDADRFIPKEETLELYRERKVNNIHRNQKLRPYQNYVTMENRGAILAAQRKYEELNGIDMEALFEKKAYGEVVTGFGKYLSYQFSTNYIGAMRHSQMYRFRNRIFIPLEDDRLYMLLYSLLMTGQYARARTLADLRKKEGPLGDDLKAVDEKITLVYDIFQSFYSEDYDRTLELIGRLEENEQESMSDIIKMQLQIHIASVDSDEAAKVIGEVESLVKNFPDDAEYQKILGDYYFKAGEPDVARECYEQAEPGLANGMMLLDIADKMGIEPNYDTQDRPELLNPIQMEQQKLLAELDALCRKYGIKYNLYGKSLWYAWYLNSFPPNNYATIIMTPENAKAFLAAFEKEQPKDRRLNYAMNNEDHHSFTIDYVDDGSTHIFWQYPENITSMYVRIYILKHVDKNKMKMRQVRLMDTALAVRRERLGDDKKKEGLWHKIITAPMYLVYGKRKLAAKVFEAYLNMEPKKPGSGYFLTESDATRSYGKKMKAVYFDEPDELEFQGLKLFIPCNMERYLKDYYGVDPELKHKPESAALKPMAFVDCDISPEEFLEVANTEVHDMKIYQDYLEGMEMTDDIRAFNKMVRHNIAILHRAEDRFKLYLEYMPMKEEIMEAYKKEDVERLDILFEDYYAKAKHNLHYHNLGIYFDPDIFEAFLYCLRNTKHKRMAERLEESIPEEHLEPIQILD